MNTVIFMIVLAGVVSAAEPIQPRITPAALAALQEENPMDRLEKTDAGGDKAVRPGNQSIIGQSTVLHDGRHWTLVPKGALIFVPKALGDRTNAKSEGTLLPWLEFLARNRSWLTTKEVSIDQAAGKSGLPAAEAAFWTRQDKIVVATHQHGPISVRIADTTSNPSTP